MIERMDLKSFLVSPVDAAGTESLIQSPGPSLRVDLRRQMTQLLGINQAHSQSQYPTQNLSSLSSIPAEAEVSELPSSFSSALPSLLLLKDHIIQDLEGNLRRLLDLNVSRREAIAVYLDQLANHIPGPNTLLGGMDPAGGLRRWLEGPRSPNQEIALQTYFEEIALVFLGQAILLKAWNDRGTRPWAKTDLGDLNWALASTLKPFVPLDRDGWQFTKRNLYSWYIPGPQIQHEIWSRLEAFPLTDDGPSFLTTLLAPVNSPRPGAVTGYDPRFYQALWMCSTDLLPPAYHSGFQRNRVAFSPTLRDGSIVRSGPREFNWIGTENSLFQLIVSELAHLWWGPCTPPLWMAGTGLEVHSRDQLALGLNSAKPTIATRIAEMEACDVAYVFEERAIRSAGRSIESLRYREQVEALPYFKKLKRANTSLGSLQACVAISKLRPGGILWWAREEPLSPQDGEELLGFFLEKVQIIGEWDFAGIRHNLPSAAPPLPKYLYLMKREPSVEARGANRPLRIHVSGHIRSHIELPLLLSDMTTPITQNPLSRSAGQWQIRPVVSPLPQQEWKDRWPDPTSHDIVESLEKLKLASSPLAQIATVVTAGGVAKPILKDPDTGLPTLHGFVLEAAQEGEKRYLKTYPLESVTEYEKGTFLVYLRAATWSAPLRSYIESSASLQWLEQHAERRGNRWLLNEQVVKWLPVPKTLIHALGAEDAPEAPKPLMGDWEKWAAEVAGAQEAKTVQLAFERLQKLPLNEMGLTVRASLFVRAARAIAEIQKRKIQLRQVVREDGAICWRKILEILPKTEPIAVNVHPQVKLTGNVPLHLPIHRIEKVKTPIPGILFATEIGMTLHLSSEHPRIVEMVMDQLENVQHPTWAELTRYLRLPRRPEFAEGTASEILRSYGELQQLESAFGELLAACQLF